MAIVDNNILSSLAKIERLDFLRSLWGTVYTAPTVVHELRDERIAGFDFVASIESILTFGEPTSKRWLAVAALSQDELEHGEALVQQGMAPADAECLSLAELRQTILLTDDTRLGEIAEDVGVSTADLETLLLAFADRGFVDDVREGRRLIRTLQERDYYIFADSFREKFLGSIAGSEV